MYKLLIIILVGVFTPIFAGINNEIILPLKFSSQGFSITSIQIQGKDISLIFDTGASRISLALSKSIVKKLNLKIIPTGEIACHYDDTGTRRCTNVNIIPEIKIGNMTVHDVPCELVDKLWGGHYDEGFIWFAAARNGVIGMDILRQFNVLVDYKNSRVILNKLGEYPQQYDLKNWLQVPFSSSKNGINMMAKINGANVSLVWDSGANTSIMKSTAKITAEKKSCATKINPHCEYFETTSFAVGDKELPKTKFFVQEEQFPFDGLIGSSFFKEHQVFFDFKNNILFINKK